MTNALIKVFVVFFRSDYLGNETIADAMMDRLIHTAHKLELKGGSMREYLAKK